MKLSTAILVVSLSITPTLTHGVTIAQWTFESSVLTTAGPIAPEIGSGQGTAYHSSSTTSFSNRPGNGSAESWSANHWSVDDYWQFSVSTVGFKDIQISFDQYGSLTGPRDFALIYGTGDVFTRFDNYSLLSSGKWQTVSFDLSGIAALNGLNKIYLQIVNITTNSLNGNGVKAVGTDRIDNFAVSGTSASVGVPDSLPLHFAAAGLFGLLIFARRHWLAAPGRMPN